MKHLTVCLACALALGLSDPLLAESEEVMEKAYEHHSIIALKTNDFELVETDVSDLAVGEAETIVTESGKTIDLLRTADGVEVYVDGELLELNLDDATALHGAHEGIHKRIEVVCESTDDCEEMVWIGDESGLDMDATDADGKTIKIIRHRIEVRCEDGQDCSSSEEAFSEREAELGGGTVHIVRLHEDTSAPDASDAANVIVIKKLHHD
jgi:hypothetical protein